MFCQDPKLAQSKLPRLVCSFLQNASMYVYKYYLLPSPASLLNSRTLKSMLFHFISLYNCLVVEVAFQNWESGQELHIHGQGIHKYKSQFFLDSPCLPLSSHQERVSCGQKLWFKFIVGVEICKIQEVKSKIL